MHSSRMPTTHSLLYGESLSGGSLSGGSLSGVFLSRGVSVQGVSVWGVSVWGSLSKGLLFTRGGVSVRQTPPDRDPLPRVNRMTLHYFTFVAGGKYGAALMQSIFVQFFVVKLHEERLNLARGRPTAISSNHPDSKPSGTAVGTSS